MEQRQPENPPAFPKTGNFDQEQPAHADSKDQDGMTLLDYFAAAALQGILASGQIDFSKDISGEYISKNAYIQAGSMLAERSKQP